ncbi:hypothetical protein SNL152K_3307 [Streptomyces sp. NL15-2K]|nr:hypothetical protein SNL152K_3307 [Streptomyces sp. NL15-2K]
MVASGTRYARAISAVVRPPTARRVRAICAGGGRSGWQHRKRSESVSSSRGPWSARSGVTNASRGVSAATRSSRARRASSARRASVSRRDATLMSQPRGLSGSPAEGHCPAAASIASCTASSAASKWPYRLTSAPRTRGMRPREARR